MDTIVKFNSVDDYNKAMGVQTFHPLVSIIDFSQVSTGKFPAGQCFGCYTVF